MFPESEKQAKCKRFYLRYHKDVFAKAFALLHHHHDAEDAAQEAWRIIFKNIHTFPDEENETARATILTVAKYRAIDIFRKRCRTEDMTEDLEMADWETRSVTRSFRKFVKKNQRKHFIPV